MKPHHSRSEDRIIEAFVKYLDATLYPGLQITKWPDKENRLTPDIDAIAEGAGKYIAIEHTSIDSFRDQRRQDDWFQKAIGCLEDELKGQLNCRLRITTPFGAVPTGVRWDEVRDHIRMWILHDAPSLRDDEIRHSIRIEGVPFPLTVQKSNSSVHGLFLARSVNEDTDFPERLQSQIDRKAPKLAKYKDCSDLRILLIENDDVANMSRGTMIKAVTASYPSHLPTGLDKIWYADSSIPKAPQFWNITPASRKNMMPMTAREELEIPPE